MISKAYRLQDKRRYQKIHIEHDDDDEDEDELQNWMIPTNLNAEMDERMNLNFDDVDDYSHIDCEIDGDAVNLDVPGRDDAHRDMNRREICDEPNDVPESSWMATK